MSLIFLKFIKNSMILCGKFSANNVNLIVDVSCHGNLFSCDTFNFPRVNSKQQQQATTSNTQNIKNIDERIMNTPRKVEPKNNNKNINIISMLLCMLLLYLLWNVSFQHYIINTSHKCDRWWIIQLSIENGVDLYQNKDSFKGPFYVLLLCLLLYQ